MLYLDPVAEDIAARVGEGRLDDPSVRRLFRIYALLALSKGEAVDAADVHDAWAVWMTERDSGHEALRPFSELDHATREKDGPFVQAIREAAVRFAGAFRDGRVRPG